MQKESMAVAEFIPDWARMQVQHRRGEISVEEAEEISRRLKQTMWWPRFFRFFWGSLGLVAIVGAVLGAPPAPAWLIAGILLIVMAFAFQLIVMLRFRGAQKALRDRKLETCRGVLTGVFAFSGRSPSLEILLSIDHRRYQMLAPSVEDKWRLREVLKDLISRKSTVLACALLGTRLLIAIEPERI